MSLIQAAAAVQAQLQAQAQGLHLPPAHSRSRRPWRSPGLGVRSLRLLEVMEQKRQYWPWNAVQAGPLKLSPLGLGTWAWGNQLLWGYEEGMDAELQQCFDLAVRRGVTLFDTADSYGIGKLSGRSELLLGRFLAESPDPERARRRVKIATKFASYPWRLSPAQFVRACRGSLARLNVERLGIGQLHWSTARYAPFQEQALWDGLVAMYDAGLVEAVGVSNYGPQQLLRVHNYLRRMNVPVATAQIQFSLISNGIEQTMVKSICDDLGIKLIAYSPLGLGMLTGKYSRDSLPRGPRGVLFRQILPGLDPLLRCLRSIAKKRGKTSSQVAVNWCMCKGTVPIPGVKTIAQVEENLGALGWRLTGGEVAELDAAAHSIPRGMIQNIFQTD